MAPIQLQDPKNSKGQVLAPVIQRPNESKTQTIDRLAAELKVAKMAQVHSERRLMELEDVVRQKDLLMEISSQQAEAAWDSMAELKKQLAAQDIVIKRLKEDAKDFPLSNPALTRSNQLLSETIDTMRECFTCPLCYDGLAKSDAVSLRCGHTFCQNCINAWAESSATLDPGRSRFTKKVDEVQCPECRTTGSVRVRLYMLEEAIRLLARAEREREMVNEEEQKRRADLEVVLDPKPSDYMMD
ncbi:hypothetical protein BY996DRAFT_8525164 [Phakopsora pachyrhizi]|uniref:RING-type domain-containing protein n=1 Tax=Phakopsora pachyrhizi TaxID=170000 RepID=A0AAV0BR82_PHAPC|nr:hypothetical protein BY996DRAFT_8525164 [Phakopsora pachyrhizi]CAH7688564.1 hypothetical protein PPACK8108_LOCUS23533 [Phakopsora pachyrhizi]